MIGSSEPMQRVFPLARQIAVYDTTVLITGASGTGKEMVARGIHQLLDAQRRRDGGGGLQRDPGNSAGKRIVRPCQGGLYRGPGSTEKGCSRLPTAPPSFSTRSVNCPWPCRSSCCASCRSGRSARSARRPLSRLISASWRPRRAICFSAFRRGTFREDLFYRLNVVPVWIPPLRERPEDVPGLVNLFISRFNNLLGTSVAAASPEAMDLLLSYRWPGNVRELENAIQRALVVSGGRFIEANHLPQKIQKQAISKCRVRRRSAVPWVVHKKSPATARGRAYQKSPRCLRRQQEQGVRTA